MAGKGVTLLVAACGLILTALPASADPQPVLPSPVLTGAAARDGIDLDGAWHYAIDPYRSGLYGPDGGPAGPGERRFDTVDVGAAMRRDPEALYEYDMARAPTARVPGSWLTYAPEMRHYQGLVWFRRSFDAPPKGDMRAFLRFGAANYSARVYLNGEFVGAHQGGFTPFAFEVTGLLRDGANQATVGVDSTRSDESIPPPVTDWETYGGLTRPVKLVLVPQTFIDDFWIRLTDDGSIAATVILNGPESANQPVHVRVAGLDAAIDGVTDANGEFTGAIAAPAALQRWSPDDPRLYNVTAAAARDTLRDRVGFRTVAVKGDDILLNGRPIFLRGVSLHEEELGANPDRRITPAAARALLSLVKALHGNFVRLAHYPHSEIVTRLADTMGIMVWSEIPVYWRADFSDPDTLALARNMLAENILRDRNRASVIVWSVGNETPQGPDRLKFLSTLADDARRLDGTRLVSAALLASRRTVDGRPETVIDDPLIPSLDLMAVNTYAGWYGGQPLDTLPDTIWHSPYDKPLILSEFGAGALAGFRDSSLHPHKFSEEFQAEYYRQTLAMAAKIPFLRGLSAWVLKDFRSPRRQNPVYQNGWNRKGLVSETGVRKQAFGILAGYYRSLEKSWQDRAPPPR